MKILVLGDGLLGSEIVRQTGWDYISAKKDGVDANHFGTFIVPLSKYDTIINCIGYTNTYDVEKEIHWNINYKFVANLVDYCDRNDKKLVHISTDYIYANAKGDKDENSIPVHQQTWYSYCKLLADGYVQLRASKYLMFRCSFKPKPFPYEKAFNNVKGNFDYVDVIAGQMIDLINENRQGIWNIGTEFKSIYQLAIRTKPDIDCWHNELLPTIQMDLSKFNNRK
jgi:dTDP-4-dehydrorhamnose reductase